MAQKYWLKLYLEILDDPKMGRMSDTLWRRTVELFLLAAKTGEDGSLPPIADMAWALRITESDMLDALEQLATLGVVFEDESGWMVTHFAERQDADTHAERQMRYKETRRASPKPSPKPVTNSHTDGDATVTQPVTNSQTEEEKSRVEKSRVEESRVEAESPAATAALNFSADPACERIFQEVTGWVSFPIGERDNAIDAVRLVLARQGSDRAAAEYLRPFFAAARKRYPHTTKLFWLTDWALSGQIPDDTRARSPAGGGGPAAGRVANPMTEALERARKAAANGNAS